MANEVGLTLSVPGDVALTLESGAVTIEPPKYGGPYAVSPSEEAQTLATSGLTMGEDVTVGAIPATRPDVSADTVTAAGLAKGLTAHDSTGARVTGSHEDAPAYSGATEVTPTKAVQVLPTRGTTLSEDVTVAAIPAKYADVSGDTVTAWSLARGYTAHDSSGAAVVGTGNALMYVMNTYLQAGAFKLTDDVADVTSIRTRACYGSYAITEVALPKVTKVGLNAFTNCPNLVRIDLPACTDFGEQGASSCGNLASVSLPACQHVSWSSFYSCPKLTEVDLPECLSIRGTCFAACSSLVTVRLPKCTDWKGKNVFQGCTALKSVYVPDSMLDALRAQYADLGLSSAGILKPASEMVS